MGLRCEGSEVMFQISKFRSRSREISSRKEGALLPTQSSAPAFRLRVRGPGFRVRKEGALLRKEGALLRVEGSGSRVQSSRLSD